MAAVTVRGKIRGFDFTGKPRRSVFVKVAQSTTPHPTGDFGSKEIKTDTSGDFTVDLQQDILYVIDIPDIPVQRTIKIPTTEAGPIDLFDFWNQEDVASNYYGDES